MGSAQHCNGNYADKTGYKTFADAMKYCQKVGPNKCTGVYDERCAGKDLFYACDSKPYVKSSSGSCVYKLAGYGSLWTKQTKKHCFNGKHAKSYKTLADAQKACLGLGKSCSGVYDETCNDKGEFYTCTTAKWATSSSSCIYTPPKPATTPKPTTQKPKPTTQKPKPTATTKKVTTKPPQSSAGTVLWA